MKQKWGREDDAGDFPSDRAVWSIGAFCVALLSVFAIAGYRYMRVWTPLQRHYLLTYAGTPVAGSFWKGAPHPLFVAVARDGAPPAPPQSGRPLRSRHGDWSIDLPVQH